MLLVLLAAVQFTHILDFMIMMPLGPQLMRQLSISAMQFSGLISAYTITSGLIGLLLAPFMDRYDRRHVLVVSYIGFIAGTYACAMAHTAGGLLFARAVCGAFGGISSATIMAIVGDIVPPERRGRAMGIIMTAFSAAAALGVPFGLYLAQLYRWKTPFLWLAWISVAVLVLLLVFLPNVRGHLEAGMPASLRNFVSLLQDGNAWRALIFMAAMVFGHFSVIPFLSPHLVFNLGLPEKDLPYVYLVGGLLTIVSSPIVGKLTDRFGRQEVFTGMILVACAVIFTIANVAQQSVAVILILAGLFFIFASGRFVPGQATMTLAVEARQRGAFMSLSSCTRDLCSGLSAMIGGVVVTRSTEGALLNFHWLGWIAIVCSLVSIGLIRWVKVADQGHFPKPAVAE
jgi:predicted MFS family arabinose efflux permease